MQRLLITVCTYNELENIRQLVPQLRAVAPEADILVIDDNSPDGTSVAVAEMQKTDSRVLLLTRSGKLGLGTALRAGFRYGIDHQYDLLLNLDADFSHDPRYIPDLLQCMDRCDVAIGSRYVEGGGAVDWNWYRRLISRSINLYARLLLGLKTQDNSGSYRCYRVAKLAEVDWDRVICPGYGFMEEVIYRCGAVGCTFAETPIMFEDRRHGVTKINWREAVGALTAILQLAGQRLRRVSVRHADMNS
jgi:dolichol-phosphate mannosyltransferase